MADQELWLLVSWVRILGPGRYSLAFGPFATKAARDRHARSWPGATNHTGRPEHADRYTDWEPPRG